MSEKTLTMLLTALTEELEQMKLKPNYRTMRDDPVCMGDWCRRDQAFKAFGLSPHRLKQMVIDGKVIAKKLDPNEPTSVVVFKTADIRRAIESMPNYTYENTNTKQEGE